jgi:hypothetical protein
MKSRSSRDQPDAISFIGNARTVLQDRLARLLRIGEGCSIDVDHDLVALAGGAGIKPMVEGRLSEQSQRIRLLLSHPGRFL